MLKRVLNLPHLLLHLINQRVQLGGCFNRELDQSFAPLIQAEKSTCIALA
jgi:hypothetical protein